MTKTEADRKLLEQIEARGIPPVSEQPPSYENLVVLKPWGFEFECFNDGASSMWFLYIKAGHMSSFHCHPNKSTTFIPVDGIAGCNTLAGVVMIMSDDALIIDKGAFHRPFAARGGDLLLIEWETPANKTDLVRRYDLYGRQNQPYEDVSRMVTTNLDRYGYFRFEELPWQ